LEGSWKALGRPVEALGRPLKGPCKATGKPLAGTTQITACMLLSKLLASAIGKASNSFQDCTAALNPCKALGRPSLGPSMAIGIKALGRFLEGPWEAYGRPLEGHCKAFKAWKAAVPVRLGRLSHACIVEQHLQSIDSVVECEHNMLNIIAT
jgi:hypothetical protein